MMASSANCRPTKLPEGRNVQTQSEHLPKNYIDPGSSEDRLVQARACDQYLNARKQKKNGAMSMSCSL
jgi:hypothetical protein